MSSSAFMHLGAFSPRLPARQITLHLSTQGTMHPEGPLLHSELQHATVVESGVVGPDCPGSGGFLSFLQWSTFSKSLLVGALFFIVILSVSVKIELQFKISQNQGGQSYIEVFNPFRLAFCAWG